MNSFLIGTTLIMRMTRMNNRVEEVAIAKEDGLTSVVCVNTIQKISQRTMFVLVISFATRVRFKWRREGLSQPTQARSMSAK